jgi:hypothetical protein
LPGKTRAIVATSVGMQAARESERELSDRARDEKVVAGF